MANAAFVERNWQEHPLFECALCQFDTLSREAMIEHQEKVHGEPPARITATLNHYDRFGNLVGTREV
jgi:hypothetical protein